MRTIDYGLTWLALHKGWFESDVFALWTIGTVILAVAQAIFIIVFLNIMQEDEPTTPAES